MTFINLTIDGEKRKFPVVRVDKGIPVIRSGNSEVSLQSLATKVPGLEVSDEEIDRVIKELK